jgi:hypothetical protein
MTRRTLSFARLLPINQLGMVETSLSSEVILTRFNKLVQDLLRGNMSRNVFQPWEIELLLDIEECSLKDSARRETLRRYQKAVQRAMENGAPVPMKLSQYLSNKKSVAREVAPQA